MYIDIGWQTNPEFVSELRCRSFADGANGVVFSEGVGVVLLERLADARRLGHEVVGVVRGSAYNQDGVSNGLTAPNGLAHERVIRQALRNAGISAGQVDAVEAHGMGTALGDTIEAQALISTYGRDRAAGRPLWLGSMKSNLGHTQASGGVGGVIKMIMAMRHGLLPKTLHADVPSRLIDWSDDTVSLLVEPVPWLEHGEPRRGAVHSFGMSGTNVHIIIEEPTPPEVPAPADERLARLEGRSRTPVPWPISGRGEEALRRQARRLAQFLDARPELDIADIGHSLVARPSLSHRAVLVGASRGELLAELEKVAAGHPAAEVAVGPGEPGSGEDLASLAQAWAAGSAVEWEPVFAKLERAVGAAADVRVRAAPLLGRPLPGVGGRRPDRAGEAAGRGGAHGRPGRGLACRRSRLGMAFKREVDGMLSYLNDRWYARSLKNGWYGPLEELVGPLPGRSWSARSAKFPSCSISLRVSGFPLAFRARMRGWSGHAHRFMPYGTRGGRRRRSVRCRFRATGMCLHQLAVTTGQSTFLPRRRSSTAGSANFGLHPTLTTGSTTLDGRVRAQLTPGVERLSPGQRIFFSFRVVDFEENEQITMQVALLEWFLEKVALTYRVVPSSPSSCRIVSKLTGHETGTFINRLQGDYYPIGELPLMRKQLRTFKYLAERQFLEELADGRRQVPEGDEPYGNNVDSMGELVMQPPDGH